MVEPLDFLRRAIYQSRKIRPGEQHTRDHRHEHGIAWITPVPRGTRSLNNAIYQRPLSSGRFYVAINVSTAGTSYFKGLRPWHAHTKFTSLTHVIPFARHDFSPLSRFTSRSTGAMTAIERSRLCPVFDRFRFRITVSARDRARLISLHLIVERLIHATHRIKV